MKWIDVSTSKHRLKLYEDKRLIKSYNESIFTTIHNIGGPYDKTFCRQKDRN